jgi:hypothetical protein
MLCLASSKILTPTPLTARRVCTPAFGAGGGHTILEDARHSFVLYICKFFVNLSYSSTGSPVLLGSGVCTELSKANYSITLVDKYNLLSCILQ